MFVFLERLEADKLSRNSQVLWSACQALHRAVRNSSPGVSWQDSMKPLQHEITAIKKAARKYIHQNLPHELPKKGLLLS